MSALEKYVEGDGSSTLESVVLNGDLSKLSPSDRVIYYKKVCESLGLNPLTKPFDYLVLKGRTMLYARKDATEQLRKIHGVSIEITGRELSDGVYVVTARAKDNSGRVDESIGAVNVGSLKGEDKANAMMKAETKAKRRVTLSIAGLGILDETEISSIPGAKIFQEESSHLRSVDRSTGEVFADSENNRELISELSGLFETGGISKEKIDKWLLSKGATSLEDVSRKHLIEGVEKMKVKLKGVNYEV